jgi:basic amino acid/polyamine antiporter, APA family
MDLSESTAEGAEDVRVKLPRVLGPIEALCVIVGSVIGSGIFIVPAKVAHEVPAMGGIVFLWVLGGLFSLAGALTLAELGAMLPHAGGPYVYLKEAYGRLPAFLFGWTEFLVIRAGSIATLAAAFALYFAQLVPAPGTLNPRLWQTIAALVAITIVAVINVLGTRRGGWVQVIGTGLKVGALAVMMVLPFLMGQVSVSNLSPVWPKSFDAGLITGMTTAMVGVLWAYDGWVNTSSLAEEIRDPGRNIPRAMMLGMAILISVYIGMTIVYHLVLPMEDIANAAVVKGSPKVVAADFCSKLVGAPGIWAISLVVMCSTFISLNGNALTGPRAYFAMARDGLFPSGLCRIHPKFQTPANAIIAQAVWSILLTVLGTMFLLLEPPSSGVIPGPLLAVWTKLHEQPLYDVMYEYVIFGGMVIYTLTITSVFVLRRTRPNHPRPYRTWGYPVTPLLYIGAAIFLMIRLVSESSGASVSGLVVILLGIPAYFVFSRSSSPRISPQP